MRGWKKSMRGWFSIGLVAFLYVVLPLGAASAAHDPLIILDPTVNRSGENVVYTLLISNEGDPIENVRIIAPTNFENFEEIGTPSGWSCSIVGSIVTYLADENAGIFSGDFAEFEFQARTPILGAAIELTDNWFILTTDNTGSVENSIVSITVDNLSPTLSAETDPSPAPAGNVWLIVTASEPLDDLDNVYLAVENSLIENAEERKHWENLIRIQGPITMSTTDAVNWKGIIAITENLEDNAPRVLVLPRGAVDLVGNEMINAFTQSLGVDTRPPVLAQVSALPSETNQPHLTLSGVAEDAVLGVYAPVGGLTIRINTNYDFLLTITDNDGSFEVEIELTQATNLVGVCAVDDAGNMSAENLQAIVFDNVPPEIENYRLVKNGVVITTENNAQITEARPEIRVNVYDFWMGVRTLGMALRGEDGSELELDVVFENENNLLKGVPKQDLTSGTYTVTVTVTDGLTIPLNHSSSWWVFSYGVPPTPVEEPSPAVAEKVVLPPREEVPVWGFPPPENIVVEGAAPAQEFSAHFGPYPVVVNRIEVTLSENVRVELRFENLENIPPGTPEPENLIIYACFRILLNVSENIIQETRVTFSVDKWWVEQRVEENTVALHKYIEENGLWKSLPTIQTDENGTHVFYSAWAEGLSVFVVGGVPRVVQPPPLEKQVLEEPQVPTEEPPVPIEEPQVPAEEPQLPQERRPIGERQVPEGGGLMLVLLAVALLILVIFWFW